MLHSPPPPPTPFKIRRLSKSASTLSNTTTNEAFLGFSSLNSPMKSFNGNNGIMSPTLPFHHDMLANKLILSPCRSLAHSSASSPIHASADPYNEDGAQSIPHKRGSPNSRKLLATVTIKRKHSSSNNNNIVASLLGSGFQGLFGQSVQEFEAKLDSAGLNKITLQLISHKIDPSTYA